MKLRKFTAALAVLATLLIACGEDVEVLTLSVGECFDAPEMDGSNLVDVNIVDCDAPHTGEVYAAITASDSEFPGDDALVSRAEQECLGAAFESYVGIDYDSSDFYAIPVFPSAESWEAGDRATYCVIADGSQLASANAVEGSLRGAAR